MEILKFIWKKGVENLFKPKIQRFLNENDLKYLVKYVGNEINAIKQEKLIENRNYSEQEVEVKRKKKRMRKKKSVLNLKKIQRDL